MKRLLSIALIATTLFACSKSDSDEPSPNECIISEISSSEPSKTTFNYNSEGKIRTASYNTEWAIYDYSVNYTANAISIIESRDGNPSEVYNYTLVNGKITTKNMGRFEESYAYNNDGFLTSITYNSVTKVTLSYSSGNLTQLKSSYDNQTYTVGYSSEDSRVPFSEFHFGMFKEWGPTAMFEDALLYEQGYFGNKTKNQISSLKVGNDTESYSFAKDSAGKILSGKSDHYNLSFKYDCK